MPQRITRKWRPRLGLVVGGTLVVVLGLPVIGALVVGNALGRSPVKMVASLNSEVGISATLFVLLVTLVLGVLLRRLILGPVQALADGAEAVADGNAEAMAPLAHYGTQEIEALGQAVLDMGRALNNREAGLRAYSDHVTHELKSPLTTLQGGIELLGEPDLSDAARARLLSSMDGATRRMSDLLGAMQTLARAREPFGGGPSGQLSDVVPGIDGLTIRVARDGTVAMPMAALEAVLMQLAQNAGEHGASEVTIEAQGTGFDVFDNGPGVSPGNSDRVFDPFFTTRRDQGGTGLGLSIARTIVETARGELTLARPRPGEGARFQIRF